LRDHIEEGEIFSNALAAYDTSPVFYGRIKFDAYNARSIGSYANSYQIR